MNLLKSLFVVFVFCLITTSSYSQENSGFVLWGETRKLTIKDFSVKSTNQSGIYSFGQFSFDFKMKGMDVFSKSLNKCVSNYFNPSVSWIDTVGNVNTSILYQQTVFDISEIYARQFRKALKENKRQLIKGTKFIEGLNERYINEFSKRRLAYATATNYANKVEVQKEWELQIQKELNTLSEYAFDK